MRGVTPSSSPPSFLSCILPFAIDDLALKFLQYHSISVGDLCPSPPMVLLPPVTVERLPSAPPVEGRVFGGVVFLEPQNCRLFPSFSSASAPVLIPVGPTPWQESHSPGPVLSALFSNLSVWDYVLVTRCGGLTLVSRRSRTARLLDGRFSLESGGKTSHMMSAILFGSLRPTTPCRGSFCDPLLVGWCYHSNFSIPPLFSSSAPGYLQCLFIGSLIALSACLTVLPFRVFFLFPYVMKTLFALSFVRGASVFLAFPCASREQGSLTTPDALLGFYAPSGEDCRLWCQIPDRSSVSQTVCSKSGRFPSDSLPIVL